MQALMMSKRNHMFFIIKRGENVNVCIHDFDDAKEETNKALLQDFFKIKPCLKTKGFKVMQGSGNRLPGSVIDYQKGRLKKSY